MYRYVLGPIERAELFQFAEHIGIQLPIVATASAVMPNGRDAYLLLTRAGELAPGCSRTTGNTPEDRVTQRRPAVPSFFIRA